MPASDLACSLIIPAYNELRRFEQRRALENYDAALARRFGDRYEILVILNGCTDDSEGWLRERTDSLPRLRPIVIPQRGKGHALLAGCDAARGASIAFVDADGATPPESLLELLAALEKADVAMGSRYSPRSVLTRRQPRLRRVAGRLARRLIRLLFPLAYDDMLCGAKAFRREAIEAVRPQLFEGSAAIDINLLTALANTEQRIVEIPIRWEHVGDSRMRASHLIRWVFALVRIRLRTGRRPRGHQ